MKKQLFGSLILGTLLLANSNASMERIGGYVGFDAIEEHNQEAMHSSNEAEEHASVDEEHSSKKEEEEKKNENTIVGMASSMASEFSSSKKEEEQNYSSSMSEAEMYHSSMKNQSEGMASSAMDQDYEHMYSSAKSEGKEYHSLAKSDAEEANSTAMEKEHEQNQDQKERVHELVDLMKEIIHDNNTSEEVKEVAKEIKYAVEFYKKEDLVADVNISDLKECNETCLNELREKAQKAYEERKKELAKEVLKQQQKVQYQVAGYFVKTGEGQYDWAFVLPNGDVYKLAGVDATGHFKYEKEVGKAQVTTNGYVYLPGSTSGEGLMFVNYKDPAENGFDWVIVTKDGKLYKLEGYDQDSKTFVYTPVDGAVAQPQGNEVVILPGT